MTDLSLSKSESATLPKSKSTLFDMPKLPNFVSRVAIYLLLVFGAFLVLVPFAWTLSTSLKTDQQVLEFPPRWIPDPVVWENYPEAFTARPFDVFIKNSLLITVLSVVGQTLSSAVVAFGFARLRFKGRNVLFFILLSTMMVPFHLLIIPRFVMFKQLGWLDTFLPLIVPNLFGSAFSIFLLRQYYMTIPLELDDAAKIDGAGFLQTFWYIILPLSKPALGVVATFEFIESWSDFMGPLIYLNSEKNYTVPLGLYSYQADYFPEWNLFMAASVIAMMLPLLVFFIAQKYFISGIALVGSGGSKG